MAFKAQEEKISSYEAELSDLRKAVVEKENALSSAETEIVELNSKLAEAEASKSAQDETKIQALKVRMNL